MTTLYSSRTVPFQVALLAVCIFAFVGFLMPHTTHALPPNSSNIDDDGGTEPGGGGTEPSGGGTPTVSITASPSNIERGYSSRLSFSSTYVTRCVIDNGVGIVAVNRSDSRMVAPAQTTTYTISCDAAGRVLVDNVTISVVSAAPAPLTAYCEAGPDTAQVQETIQWNVVHSTGSASGLVWKRGQSFTTKVCTGGQNYAEPNSTCSDGVTDGATCSVEGQRCKESAGCDGSTYTDPSGQQNAHTQYGSVTPYTCVASGPSSATYSYSWTGTDSLSGTMQTISKAYASAGQKTARATVNQSSGTTGGYGWRAIGAQSGPTCTDDVNSVTGGADHRTQPTCSAAAAGTRYTQYDIQSGSESGCSPQRYSVTGQDYVCEASSGTTTGSASATCTANISSKTPTATLTANPTSIASGSSSTLSWSSTNASECSLNESIGTVATSGTRSVSPGSTTTYTLMCVAPSTGSTVGTWHYYDSDTNDFSCPVTDTNKAYSSVPNCPANPQGKACTTGSGMNLCKQNTVNGCNINTDLYQCQASGSSPSQAATATATVTVLPPNSNLTADTPPDLAGKEGVPMTLTVTARNNGAGSTAKPFPAMMLRYDTIGGSATIVSLYKGASARGIPNGFPAGYSEPVSASYTPPDTKITRYYRLCVDMDDNWTGSVTETNEADNCSGYGKITVTATPPTVSCTASPTTITAGSSSTWTASPGGLGTYSWTPSETGTPISGGQTLSRTYSAAGTYAMSVSAGGATASCSSLVTVSSPSCGASTPTITASPTRVQAGNTSTLTVSASGVDTTCVVSGPGVSRTISGSSCVVPSTTITTGAITSLSTYTITCDSGESSAKTLVNVVPKIQEF